MCLIKKLGKEQCDATEFGKAAKAWVNSFTSLYQTSDVTPYMHAMAMHVPEFLNLYGGISKFSQGLEKLNDVTTKDFLRGTNHRNGALQQILERRNRVEELEDHGYKRKRRSQKCQLCYNVGHNSPTCPSRKPTWDATVETTMN